MKKANIILLSITLVFCAGVIEVFSRILLSTNHFQRKGEIRYLNQKKINKNPSISNSPYQKYVPNPYSLYKVNPNYIYPGSTGIKEYDSNGYRNPEYSAEKGCFRILAIGGSTTDEEPYVTRSQSWTMVLNKLLESNAKDGKCYQVFNAGLGWGTSAELLTEYLLNGIYINPDLVIIHTGGNDGLALVQKEYKTDYSHIRAQGNVNTGFMHFLSNSNTGNKLHKLSHELATIKLGLFFLIRLEGGIRAFTPAINGVFPLPPKESLEIVKSRESIAFRNNITNITRIATSRNSKVLIVPFIQAPKDQLTLNQPILQGQEETMIEIVKKHRNILKEISFSESVHFFEFNKSLFKDEWFIDNCHLNVQGSNEKARQLYSFIKSSNLIQK